MTRETKMFGADFEVEDCCDECKYLDKKSTEEPCKSCKIVVTNWEPTWKMSCNKRDVEKE